jgi:hypothetical protein
MTKFELSDSFKLPAIGTTDKPPMTLGAAPVSSSNTPKPAL